MHVAAARWVKSGRQAATLAHYAQLGLLLLGVPLALYLALFAQIGPVHDALHSFRHSLTLVTCH